MMGIFVLFIDTSALQNVPINSELSVTSQNFIDVLTKKKVMTQIVRWQQFLEYLPKIQL